MNVGGEPDRDDFGLPPVDIEVPDDARDLDRDVQAYHRELRAARRRRRFRRLHAPLTGDGLMLPLLAGCLVMVIISAVLLTVFSSGQSSDHPLTGATGLPSAAVSSPLIRKGSAPARSPKPSPSARPVRRLTNVRLVLAGRPVRLYKLLPAVLALVPARCQCTAALSRLRERAATDGDRLVVVGHKSDIAGVTRQAVAAGQPAAGVADDTVNALGKALRPAGLTAAFVQPGGSVTYVVSNLLQDRRLASQFQSLTGASP